ncbi:MAG: methyltransferase domain-containing protein [bacterium]
MSDKFLVVDNVAWEERYQNNETGWDRGQASQAVDVFCQQFKAPAHILVPGCGRGYEVIAFIKQGFEVTAVDLSETAIAELGAKLDKNSQQANLYTADFFKWQPKQAVDFIYEQTSLCAIPPANREAYAEQLYHWLKPGGSVFALLMQTHVDGGPPFHCDLEEMKELFPASKWAWEEKDQTVTLSSDKYEHIVILTKLD